MTSEQGSGATWIARDRRFNVTYTITFWVAVCFLIFPVSWPVEVLHDKHPPVAVFVYLAIVAVALIWSLYRAWHVGVRFDGHGVMVWNYFRTHQARWAEVSSFADGSTNGRNWALAVMLRDGRGVTATATVGRPGRPEILTALRQAAAAHQVPAKLTGIGTERPRAWQDAASEARRKGAWSAAWLAVAVIALAAVVPLFWFARTHSHGHHPVNFYPAAFAAGVAVIGLLAARAAWRRRQQFLGQRPVPQQDRYGEGDWFAVPLLPGRTDFALGLIARAEPRQGGIVLCYFFPPRGSAEPALAQLRELHAADAVLVQKLDGLERKWPRLGRAPGWDRDAWPLPAFGRSGKKTGQVSRVIYDDDLRFVGEEMADRTEVDTLPSNELLQAASVPTVLARLLPKPSGAVSVKRGGRMRCVECGAKMGTARRCRRCGAPVPGRPQYQAPGTEPVGQRAPKWPKAITWIGGVLLNVLALWIGIGFAYIAITEGSPAQMGQDYVPLWACLFMAIICGSVPTITVVLAVRHLRARARERRATDQDSLEQLPESLG